MTGIRKSRHDYTLSWLTALPRERSAAEAVLDKTHEGLRASPGDENAYTLGEIQGHNVVITCLPSGHYGITRAAHVASRMKSSFPNLRYGLLVGIGGGVPDFPRVDIRLGDIVVGQPSSTHEAVVQYDFGKSVDGVFQRTGALAAPPSVLLSALSKLQAHHKNDKSKVPDFLRKLGENNQRFRHPGQERDHLFNPLYNHKQNAESCDDCDQLQIIKRPKRSSIDPVVHYGVIGTGNLVIKDTQMREKLAKKEQLLCFEMEAAGLVNEIPSLVVRGICDYSDTHKNKHWQDYAAAAAAAYAKDFLSVLPPHSYIGNQFKLTMNLSSVPTGCKFVGRITDLQKLSELLLPDASISRKVVTLHGISGIGKTQLARQFIREYKENFTAAFWVNAQRRESIIQSLASVHLPRSADDPPSGELASDEDMEKKAMNVIEWLNLEGNSKWLVVFDGLSLDSAVADVVDIQKFFPMSDQGSILLTTQSAPAREVGYPYRLLKLNPKESLELLGLTAGLTISENMPSDVHNLLDRLDGHPLAIAQAGSFMSTGATVSECLQQYSTLWQEQKLPIPRHHPHFGQKARTAWMLPFEETKRSNPIAFKMLLLLSCFDQQDIWPQLIKAGLVDGFSPGWYIAVASSSSEFYQAMSALLRLGLVDSRASENSYSMHPVVQGWCQSYLVEHDREELLFIALASVGLSVPDKDEPEAWKWQRRVMPHASRIYQLVQGNLTMQPSIKLADATRGLGSLFFQYGKLREAEAMSQKAYEWYQELDPQNLGLLIALDNLGLVFRSQSKYGEAEEIHNRVLRDKKARLGSEHPSILDTTQHLADLYESQGRLMEAKDMYETVLVARQAILRLGHPSTLSTMDKLGIVYSDLGDMEEAMRYHQRAYQGYRKQHLISAMMNTTNSIGLIYLEKGDFGEATRHLRKVAEEGRKILGDDHPFVFNALENLGLLYTKQGKFDDARRHLFEALANRIRVLGPEHHSVTGTRDNIAHLYVSQGKMEDAENEYRKAWELGNRTLGPSHTTTLRILNNLGNLYFSRAMYREAEQNFLRARDGYKRVFGSSHTDSLSVTMNLGNIYKAQDKRGEAEQMYKEALAGYAETMGESHPTTLSVMNNLALLYFDYGRYQASEELLDKCKEKKVRLFGSDHPSTLGAINNLGLLKCYQGRFKEADALIRTSLAGREKIGHSQNILETKSNLGMACTGLGRFEEAEAILKQCLARVQELLDPDHPLIFEVAHNLGVLAVEQGETHEAKRQFRSALDGRRRIFGVTHTFTLETALGLSNCLRDAGELTNAKARYVEVTNSLKASLGPDHPSTLQAQCHFGALLLDENDQNSLSHAETLITRSLNGLQATFGWSHLFTARAMVQMGRLRAKQGHFREAKELYSKAHLGFESTLGGNHREAVSAKKTLHAVSTRARQQMYRRLILVTLIPLVVGICAHLAKGISRPRFFYQLLHGIFGLFGNRERDDEFRNEHHI